MDSIPFNFFDLSYQDFGSWIKVQQAYIDNAFGENVLHTGYESGTGYVYIMLQNSVVIACAFGQDVEYFKSFEDFWNSEDSFECYSNLLNQ